MTWHPAATPPPEEHSELLLLWIHREGEQPTYDFGFHDDRGFHCRMDGRYKCTVRFWARKPPLPPGETQEW